MPLGRHAKTLSYLILSLIIMRRGFVIYLPGTLKENARARGAHQQPASNSE
jgi:hypothetical protein